METRAFKSDISLRDGSGPALSGHAFLFNQVSEDGAYGKEAFPSDCKIRFAKKVFLLRGHNKERILARRGRNMEVKPDAEGLAFQVSKLPDTELGRETRALLKEGILSDVSIGFMLNKSSEREGIRQIKDITLHEISIVGDGYHEGKVSARAKEKPPLPPELIC